MNAKNKGYKNDNLTLQFYPPVLKSVQITNIQPSNFLLHQQLERTIPSSLLTLKKVLSIDSLSKEMNFKHIRDQTFRKHRNIELQKKYREHRQKIMKKITSIEGDQLEKNGDIPSQFHNCILEFHKQNELKNRQGIIDTCRSFNVICSRCNILTSQVIDMFNNSGSLRVLVDTLNNLAQFDVEIITELTWVSSNLACVESGYSVGILMKGGLLSSIFDLLKNVEDPNILSNILLCLANLNIDNIDVRDFLSSNCIEDAIISAFSRVKGEFKDIKPTMVNACFFIKVYSLVDPALPYMKTRELIILASSFIDNLRLFENLEHYQTLEHIISIYSSAVKKIDSNLLEQFSADHPKFLDIAKQVILSDNIKPTERNTMINCIGNLLFFFQIDNELTPEGLRYQQQIKDMRFVNILLELLVQMPPTSIEFDSILFFFLNWCIMENPEEAKEFAIDTGILDKLMNLFFKSVNIDIKKGCVLAMTSMVRSLSVEVVCEIIDANLEFALLFIKSLSSTVDNKFAICCLDMIDELFQAQSQQIYVSGGVKNNLVNIVSEDQTLISCLESLQHHHDTKVYKKSEKLIDNYFDCEENQGYYLQGVKKVQIGEE